MCKMCIWMQLSRTCDTPQRVGSHTHTHKPSIVNHPSTLVLPNIDEISPPLSADRGSAASLMRCLSSV